MNNSTKPSKLFSIEKSTEDVDFLIERLNQSLKPGQFFYIPGFSDKPAQKMTKQELIDEREYVQFTYKHLNNLYVHELLSRINLERSKLNRTGVLAALKIKGLTYRRWIRLAMLRFNKVPESKKMPHAKLAARPGYTIEPPLKQGDKAIEQIKTHLIEIIEEHTKLNLEKHQREIISRMAPKSIRNMLKEMN